MAMTGDPCIPVEELEEVSRLAADDPRRRHLEVCPRCCARWTELSDFMLLTPAPPEAQPGAARRHLQRWIDTELLPPSTASRRASRSPWPWRERWTWSGGWGIAAAAAAVVVVGAFWAWQRPAAPVPGAALRGEGAPALGSMSRELFQLSIVPGAQAEGVRLRWAAVAAADAYEVTVHAGDLSVLARIDARAQTEFVVPDSVLQAGPNGTPTLVRVRALRHGDEISLSGFVRLPAQVAR